jgi:hypothetical protein
VSDSWTIELITSHIRDRIQESLVLDYKAAEALQKRDEKKKEITKDVSAMANSAGGTIIYGVRESQDPSLGPVPESIDPVDQIEFSKEWLQQVINTIRPKISGVLITPVEVDRDSNRVVYVVDVPQSNTAHQATDYRYYKRHNAISSPMEDYEIRDIMGRASTPRFEVNFSITRRERLIDVSRKLYGMRMPGEQAQNETRVSFSLTATARNVGSVLANYVNAFFYLPASTLPRDAQIRLGHFDTTTNQLIEFIKSNTVRDVVDYKMISPEGGYPKYGPARFVPVLPKLAKDWEFDLTNQFEQIEKSGLKIKWEIYADNSPAFVGEQLISEIALVNIDSDSDEED